MKKQVTFLIFSLAILSSHAQWELIEGPADQGDNYGGMSFVNDSTGFVVQRFDDWPIVRSLILKTTDYGASWDTIYSIVDSGNQFIPNFKDVFFINENEGWVCGFQMPYILHTEDGGDTWIQQDITSTEPIEIQDADFELIKFYDENYGIALNGFSGQHAIETLDGGDHWSVNDSLTGYDVSFIDECNFIINHSAWLKKTFNCDLQFQDFPTSSQENNPQRTGLSIHIIDEQTWVMTAVGLVGFNNFGSIIRTEDGGQTFQYLDLTFTNRSKTLHFRDALNGYVTLSSTYVGNDPCTIMKTDDGGVTWHCQETPIIEYLGNYLYTSFSDIECPSPNICYANTGNRIFRTFNGGGELGEVYTSVKETATNQAPISLRVFPNPATTQISITGLPQNANCDIRIYDASGREVLALLNHSENIIQIDQLIAGIYFISITSNNEINQLRFVRI